MNLQIWFPPEDSESRSLLNLELLPALQHCGWNIIEIQPFTPVHSSVFLSTNSYAVEVGLNINPVKIMVSTGIFWETVGNVWSRDDIKTAPKSLSKAFEDSGICWGSVTPEPYWGANPIPTNTIRVIVFPKNL